MPRYIAARYMLASPSPNPEPPTEPLVFGAIGHYRAEVVEAATLGLSLQTQARGPSLWLLSETPISTWGSGATKGFYWGQLNPCSTPDSMTTVQRDCGAPGVVDDGSAHHLHGDLLGVWPLYFARIDNAIYFSNRFEVVLRSCQRAHLDPYTWAAMASLWFAPPGVSIVKEISTLRPGEVISYDTGSRQFSDTTQDVEVDVEANAVTGDLLDAIGATFDPQYEHTVLLSGGFDSRLLLACALRSGVRAGTVTTSKDDGSDAEVGLARDTAEALGVSHQVVEDEGMWHDWFEAATGRMEHGTPHHVWAVPLASHVREGRQPAAFGFGGGLVLNGHMQETANDTKGTDVEVRLNLLRRMGARVFEVEHLLSDSVREDHIERVRTEFLDQTAQFAERTDWQALSLLTTRTARSIALLATRLVGPGLQVLMPYLSPSVLRFALSPKIHARRSNHLYRELSMEIGLGIQDLPATSELPYPKPKDFVRRQNNEKTLRWIARTLANDEVALAVFHPEIRRRIVAGDSEDLEKLFQPAAAQKVLHGVLMLALFRQRYPVVGGHVAN